MLLSTDVEGAQEASRGWSLFLEMALCLQGVSQAVQHDHQKLHGAMHHPPQGAADGGGQRAVQPCLEGLGSFGAPLDAMLCVPA